jgi:hypothetical protein
MNQRIVGEGAIERLHCHDNRLIGGLEGGAVALPEAGGIGSRGKISVISRGVIGVPPGVFVIERLDIPMPCSDNLGAFRSCRLVDSLGNVHGLGEPLPV